MSTETGYVDAGQLKVDVVAELRGFTRRLRKDVTTAAKDVQAKVGVTVDARGLKTQLRNVVKEAGAGLSVKATVDLDPRALRKQVQAAAKAAPVEVPVTPKVDPKAAKATEGLAALQERLNRSLLTSRSGALAVEAAQGRLAKALAKTGEESVEYRKAALAVEAAEERRAVAIRKTEEALGKLRDLTKDEIKVDVDIADVEAQLAELARPREVTVETEVEGAAEAETVLDTVARTRKVEFNVDTRRLVAVTKTAMSKLAGAVTSTVGALAKGAVFALVAGAASAAAVGVAQLAVQLGAFVAAAAPVVGLGLAIPAAFGAVMLATNTLKLGLAGMGDAMKAIAAGDAEKLKEAMEGLAPAARAVVFQLALLKPRFDELRRGVQQSLLDKLAPVIAQLGNQYLPILRRSLEGVAAGFNQAGLNIGGFLARATKVQDLSNTFAELQGAGVQLTRLLLPGLRILTDLLAVGAPLVRVLSEDLANAAQAAADFVAQARASGQLEDILRNALSVAGQLVGILKNVGGIISAVFGAANVAGGGLLANIEQITGGLRTFLASVEGQTALQSFFSSLAIAAKAVTPVLNALVQAIGNSLAPAIAQIATAAGPALVVAIDAIAGAITALAPFIAPVFAGITAGFKALAPALAPIATALGQGLAALAPALEPLGGVLAALLTAAAPLLPVLGVALANGVRFLAGMLQMLSPVITVISNALLAGMPMYEAFGVALTQMFAAIAPLVAQLAGQLAPIFTRLTPVITKIADAFLGALLPVLPQLADITRQLIPIYVKLVETLADGLLDALVAILPHVPALVTALVQLSLSANQLFLALAPIMPVFAAFLAAVLRSGVIRTVIPMIKGLSVVLSVAAKVIGTVASVLAVFVRTVLGLPAALGRAWDTIKNGASEVGTAVLGFFTSLPGKIGAALASFGRFLGDAARRAFNAMLVSVGAVIALVVYSVTKMPGDILTAVRDFAARIGAWASNAWTVVKTRFTAGIDAVVAFARALPNRIMTGIQVLVGRAQAWATSTWESIKARFSAGITAVVGFMRSLPDRVMNIITVLRTRLLSAIQGLMNGARDGFAKGVSAIAAAWGKVQDAAKKPVRFVLETVINNGLIRGYNAIASKVGIAQMSPVSIKGFARGGVNDVVPGYTPGRDVHRFYSPTGGAIDLSGGEPILRPEVGRVVGHGWVYGINDAARRGGTSGVKRYLGGYADGGVIGWLQGKARNARDWVVGELAGLAAGPLKAGLKKLISQVPGNSEFVEALRALPMKLVDGFVKWATQKDSAAQTAVSGNLRAGMGTPSVNAILTVARRFFGGAQVSSGKRNTADFHGRGLAADLVGGGAAGMRAIATGFLRMAGNLLELIHLSNGKRFAVKNGRIGNFYGSLFASGDPSISHRNHVHVAATAKALGFDSGGDLPVGDTLVRNRTGRPEAVFTQRIIDLLLRRIDQVVATVKKALAPATSVVTGVGSQLMSAAKEILNHWMRGGTVFEDFSFHGNSENVRRHSDTIARMFGADEATPDAIEKYLRGIASGALVPVSAGGMSTAGALARSSVAAPAAAAVGAGATVNVYPQQGQSEREIGIVAAREIEWARGASW